MGTDDIRKALTDYERRTGTSLNQHARRLGVAPSSLSDFLAGRTGLGSRMLRAIRAGHPELLDLLLDWLEGAGTVANSRRG